MDVYTCQALVRKNKRCLLFFIEKEQAESVFWLLLGNLKINRLILSYNAEAQGNWVQSIQRPCLVSLLNYFTSNSSIFSPSIEALSLSPTLTGPTPEGVPVKIRSPVLSVKYFDTKAMI